jgi:uncharacterized protein YbjT (DUF2867 family)
MVQVGDIAQAVVTALKTTDSIGKIYELGGPKIYTMDELYDLVQHVLRIKNLSTIELSNRTLMYSFSLFLFLLHSFFLCSHSLTFYF